MQNLTSKGDLGINLRYLLWHDNGQITSEKWSDRQKKWGFTLGSWLNCDLNRAIALMRGEVDLTPAELSSLQRATAMDDDQIMAFKNSRLYETEACDIWLENVIFLLKQLSYGENKKLASHLKIREENFSKWKKRKTRPETKYKHKLLNFFSLPYSLDLENEAIFLSIEPLSTHQQKEWLKEKIESLDSSTLVSLFPALQKLLD